MEVKIKLFYHLKEKAGTGEVTLMVPEKTTIGDLRKQLEQQFPPLRTQLDNVMVLMNKQIVLDDDLIRENAEISFLTPVGGG